MSFIMSNEYMRLWFKERGKYEKNTYSKVQIIKEESKIKRRFVQRMMTYKKPKKNEFLDEIFQKTHVKKAETNDQPTDYRKYKYKPCCLKQKEKDGLVHGEIAATEKGEGIKNAASPVLKTPKQSPKKEKHDSGNSELDKPGLTEQGCCIPCCPAQ